MQKVEVYIIALTYSESSPGNLSLILEDMAFSRRVPITIGKSEGQAIAIVLEKMKTKRPQTHDLLADTIAQLNGVVKEILIDRYESETFYAKIIISRNGEEVEIDSRTSDAVALACRVSCPMYINQTVFEAFSFDKESESIPRNVRGGSLNNYSLKELEELLDKVIQKEDYISASRIRDAIEKKKASNDG